MKTDPIMRVTSTPFPPSVCRKEIKLSVPHAWPTFLYIYCLVLGAMDQPKKTTTSKAQHFTDRQET